MQKPKSYARLLAEESDRRRQQGERRHELMRPRRWADWLLLLVVLCWGFVMGFVAFAEGVDRGTTIGIESCRAGDTVLVDPAVQGID